MEGRSTPRAFLCAGGLVDAGALDGTHNCRTVDGECFHRRPQKILLWFVVENIAHNLQVRIWHLGQTFGQRRCRNKSSVFPVLERLPSQTVSAKTGPASTTCRYGSGMSGGPLGTDDSSTNEVHSQFPTVAFPSGFGQIFASKFALREAAKSWTKVFTSGQDVFEKKTIHIRTCDSSRLWWSAAALVLPLPRWPLSTVCPRTFTVGLAASVRSLSINTRIHQRGVLHLMTNFNKSETSNQECHTLASACPACSTPAMMASISCQTSARSAASTGSDDDAKLDITETDKDNLNNNLILDQILLKLFFVWTYHFVRYA